MQAIRRVLVAVKEPAARSQPAAAKAAQLARGLGAHLELFHAIDTPLYVDLVRMRGATIEEAKLQLRSHRLRQLERIASRLRVPGLQVNVAADWDFPGHEAIVRHAGRTGAGLIVAQRHAGRHVAPWLLHMTDWELLRLSPMPVLLVKNPRRYRRPVLVAAIDPTHAHAKSARLDAEILQLGAVVRRALGGTLHAVHASVPVSAIMLADPATGLTISPELSARAASRARAGFERALRSSGISARRRHLLSGQPAEAIVHVARRTRCAIVVMGAVSRSGLKGLFVGNTAELALDRLGCDVLVTKPPRFANRIPRTVRGPRLAIAVPPP